MESNYSVLMSVYYKEHPEYLRQSMQSMYDQTIPTDDFVLVCDGPDAGIGYGYYRYATSLWFPSPCRSSSEKWRFGQCFKCRNIAM